MAFNVRYFLIMINWKRGFLMILLQRLPARKYDSSEMKARREKEATIAGIEAVIECFNKPPC
jgi:hypothetical protein